MAMTPSSLPVEAGASGSTVTFTIKNLLYFNSTVLVTLTPPAGITCSLSPCTFTASSTNSHTVTFSAVSATPVGSYLVAMHAVSGTIAHDGSLPVTVFASPATQPISPPTSPVPTSSTDFVLAVSPGSAQATAGATPVPYTVQITRLNGQTNPVIVTASIPSGFVCSLTPCAVTIAGSTSQNALALTPSATVSPGAYTLLFTGTDGTNTRTATASLIVVQQLVTTPVPVPNAPAIIPTGCRTTPYAGEAPQSPYGMRFAYTGAADTSAEHFSGLSHLVYDSIHNVVFESNATLNEVDVISPNQMTLIQRIPVPEPAGMDLSPDGKTLYVASLSPYFYSVDTSLFCVTGRQDIAADTRGNLTANTSEELLIPIEVASLSDGSVAVSLVVDGSGAGAVALWTPRGSRTLATNVYGGMVRTGDRKHLFIWSNGVTGSFVRYDVSTGTAAAIAANRYSFPEVYAANQDGSRILTLSDCCALSLMDGNLNVLASATTRFPIVLATPDFSRLYVERQDTSSQIDVVDGSTLAPLGSIPALTRYGSGNVVPSGFDGTGRILATVDMGMGAVPVGSPVQGLTVPNIRGGPTSSDSGLIPGSPAPSLATSLNGAGFTASPLVTFNGVPATNVQYVNVNVINLTAPALDTDCVDVEAMFPNGSAAMQPLGYCYRPRVLYLSGDAGPSAGGGKLTLYGVGVGDTRDVVEATRVLIGGVDASVGTVHAAGYSSYALEMTQLTVTVPPGHAGTADIEVIAPGGGTTLLPHAYTYVDTSVTALSSSVSPVEMIFDKARERVLVSDQANSQVLVYDTAGKQMRNPIAVGTSPRGIGLTPDGSQLLVLTAGDRKISVYGADTYTLQQQANVPAVAYANTTYPDPLGDPQWVLPLVNGKALLLVQFALVNGSNTSSQTYLYDLKTNQLTLNVALSTGQQPLNGAVTPDGTFAVLGNDSYDAVTGTAQPIALYAYTSVAVTPDGSRYLAGSGPIVDRTGVPQNFLSTYDLLTGIDAPLHPIGAGQVSGGSSLFYQPTNNGIRIWDVQHGSLVQNVSLPGSERLYDMPTQKLLAVDPQGGRAWTINANGLVDIQFQQDPLSIGSATVNGGQVNVQGSGFTSTMQVSIDGHPVAATVTGTTAFSAPLAVLAPGNHALQITDGTGRAYTLDLAFATP